MENFEMEFSQELMSACDYVPEQEQYNWDSFSINNEIDNMKLKMLIDVFIIDRIALQGQHTAIYAPPNSGKTLIVMHELVQAIQSNDIDAKNIFYINADDTYRGLIQKTEIANKIGDGFNMLAPDFHGFKNNLLIVMLQDLIKRDECQKKIIVLDTLKKFVDLMDKKLSSQISNVLRSFCSHGGSIISLAHVNKNQNSDGKNVYAGTSDIVDDSDCCFIIDIVSDNDDKNEAHKMTIAIRK
jgi:hypothetical protein